MSRSHDSKAGSGTDRERGLAENTMTRSPMKIFFFVFFGGKWERGEDIII